MAQQFGRGQNSPSVVTELKKENLSSWEVLAQSVANIAPSATPALIIPLVFASAGNGTWLAYVIATVAMLFMAAQINTFAKRSASPGALYTFTSLGLGPLWGAISGWSLFLAYAFTASATIAGFTNYAGVILDSYKIPMGMALGLLFLIGSLILCWYIAWKDVQLSTRFMLTLEFLAVGVMFLLMLAYFVHAKHMADGPQITLTGISPQGLRMALVLALFSFVGFESATALGGEARNPLKTIPRSVLSSVFVVGFFFTLAAYTLVMAFRELGTPLDKSTSPLLDLAQVAGFPHLQTPLAFVALIGQAACTLASLNAAARVMYSMARNGFFAATLGRVHKTHGTPYAALAVSALVAGLVPLILFLHGTVAMDIFGYMGSFATFGFLLSYVFITFAAPRYLKKRNELHAKEIITAVITLVLLLIPIVGSVYPVPDAPYNYLPYIFIALIAAGALRAFLMKKQELR